jgi:transposase InsO family protein
MPSLTATAPNQIWTWDITKLATLQKGIFLMAYVIIDLFSRFVVGWMVAAKECKHLAAQLFAETIARHGVTPGLQVHADRGSAMRSDTLAQLLDSLGASRSFSRPRVSNDNPYSEAQFKTLKYQPDYPGRFALRFTDARGSRASSPGTTTTITTRASPCSHQPMSSTAASPRSPLYARPRSTPHTARIQSASPTGRRACRCRLPPCTSTPSSRRLSRSASRSPLRPLCQRTPPTEHTARAATAKRPPSTDEHHVRIPDIS